MSALHDTNSKVESSLVHKLLLCRMLLTLIPNMSICIHKFLIAGWYTSVLGLFLASYCCHMTNVSTYHVCAYQQSFNTACMEAKTLGRVISVHGNPVCSDHFARREKRQCLVSCLLVVSNHWTGLWTGLLDWIAGLD